MVRKFLTTTAILCTLGLGSAVAGPTTIVYGDLNLATATGSATLAERVSAAAAAYCSTPAPTYLVAPAFAPAATAACIKQVKANALLQISAVGAPQQLALK